MFHISVILKFGKLAD